MSQTQMREKAVCENTNLLDAQARVQTKLNEPTESRTLKLEPKNLKGRNRGTPEDIVFNKKLTQQTNTQSQQVASAYKYCATPLPSLNPPSNPRGINIYINI